MNTDALRKDLDERIGNLRDAEKKLGEVMKRAETELAQLETLEIPEAEKQVRAAALEKNLDDAREMQEQLTAKIGAMEQLERQIEAMEEERLKGAPSGAPLETPDQKAREKEAEDYWRDVEAEKERNASNMQPPDLPHDHSPPDDSGPPVPHGAPIPGHAGIPHDHDFQIVAADQCIGGAEVVGAVVLGTVLHKAAERLPSLSEVFDATLDLLGRTIESGKQLLTESREEQDRRIEEAVKSHEQPEQTERENAAREVSRKEDVERAEQEKAQQEKHAQEREKLDKSLEVAQKRFDERGDLDEVRRAELQKELDKASQQARERLDQKQEREREQLRGEIERKRERELQQI